ncbi:ABC transporter ATP-binding protein [Vibrio barjaei]|uniref:ABC transporter ATP-binding protein n=1 Tax=Vibrio barjaei TaxID=1676683 RepID=A0ABW7IDD5_9VIBR
MASIVKVENIIKKYSKNSSSHLDYGIKDLFTELKGLNQSTSLRKDEFYAVNNVSFSLEKGQSIALIGRNGCGKTTLLKMIAGLIKPTKGRITIDGKVQALIALGAGFENKLSGRENIYNSASLIGLNYHETQKIIDEIIEFSEIEEFIDSPVETYSSGMYARLGFSVAIHLKPDLLLVDEILSVGDYAFQNKCFMKMHQLKKEGMSIILVSHSHTQVTQLCDVAVWMDKGNIIEYGKSKEVVTKYLNYMDELAVKKLERSSPKKNDSPMLYGSIYPDFDKINNFKFKILDESGNELSTCRTNDTIFLEYSFELSQKVEDLNVSINFYRKDGLLMTTISTLNGDIIKHVNDGKVHCKLRIDNLSLNPNEYVIVMPIHEGHGYLYRNVVKELLVTKHSEMMHWGVVTLNHEYQEI